MKKFKQRKNLLLDAQSVARGEQAARERNISLSGLIEKHLLSLPESNSEDYWPEIIPVAEHSGERRFDHLQQKHS